MPQAIPKTMHRAGRAQEKILARQAATRLVQKAIHRLYSQENQEERRPKVPTSPTEILLSCKSEAQC